MRRTSARSAKLGGLSGICSLLLAALLAVPAAADSGPQAHRFGPGSEDGWSSARMLAARPAEAGTAAPIAAGRAPLAQAAFNARKIPRAGSPANRVHGRLFFSAGGVDYSCSATVTTSGSGSLATTAGHCVYDHASGGFVSSVVFVPAYSDGESPFGVWRATHAVTTGEWTSLQAIDFDTAMLRIEKRDGQTLQEAVGSLGIGFGQKSEGKRLRAFGFPAAPARRYDGESLVRCGARAGSDRFHRRSLGMGCDMGFGASGGAWVAQKAFAVANTSHSHGGDRTRIYGPSFGGPARKLYSFSGASFPSVKPVRCGRRIATIVGTDRSDRIVGSKKKDVIATLGGDDRVRSKGGRDVICTGAGSDRIDAGPSRDRILAGSDLDRCDGGLGRDRAAGCERSRRIP